MKRVNHLNSRRCRFVSRVLLGAAAALAFTGLVSGCSGSDASALGDSPQAEYGKDSDYFLALLSLKDELPASSVTDQNRAERLLNSAAKESNPIIARRAMEELAKLGNTQERIRAARELYDTYGDEAALSVYLNELYDAEEYARIINITDTVDLNTFGNEIVYLRLKSMYEKRDDRFRREALEWCTERDFSSLHYALYDLLSLPAADTSAEYTFLRLRENIYTRHYDAAAENARALLDAGQFLVPQMLSDAGKSFLYGSQNLLSSAYYLDSIRASLPQDVLYYCDFYAARCYDRAGDYMTRALERFSLAMEEAISPEDFDNALWYYLNTSLKVSVDRVIEALEEYLPRMGDPSYFDDFFETLSVRLLSTHSWADFLEITNLITGKASRECSARYSYICAKLIQSGLLEAEEGRAESLFRSALNGGSDLYYKVLAMRELNLPPGEQEAFLYAAGSAAPTPDSAPEAGRDPDAETLLLGYADFGLAEYIYTDYLRYRDKIGDGCAARLADFLSKVGYEEQSIRMASGRVPPGGAGYPASSEDPSAAKSLMEAAFPRYFSEHVTASAAEFNIKEYLLYGLIRSESFFVPDAVSSAGAVGLTQLMEPTAADVAYRLRVAQYDLRDPEVNIRFGAYYLGELTGRQGGSSILAVLSYNAGITRVRSWERSAELEFDASAVPTDIFIETLPFEETREYARHVVSAAAVYAALYYGMSPAEAAGEIMGED